MGINQQEKGKREKKNQQQTTGRMGRRRGTLKSSRSSRYSHTHANTNEQNQAMGAFPKRPHAVILEARLTGQQTAESPERTHRRDADVTSLFWRLSLRSWEWAQRNASRQGNEKGECHTFQLSRAARGLPRVQQQVQRPQGRYFTLVQSRGQGCLYREDGDAESQTICGATRAVSRRQSWTRPEKAASAGVADECCGGITSLLVFSFSFLCLIKFLS